jgi:D-alanine-D-alanine ligase
MDKPLARRVFAGAGLPVAQAREISAHALGELTSARVAAAELVAALGLPVVVKVPAGGSSVGVEIPRSEAELVVALQRLSQGVSMLLCEQFIDGVELTAGVLEQADGTLQSLPLVEIAPVHADFFNYEAKYSAGGTDEIVPARVSAEATVQIQELGRRAHRALGCRGVSRTDVILRRDGQPFLLETNTLPGLTPASLLPKAAAAHGLSYEALLVHLISVAMA